MATTLIIILIPVCLCVRTRMMSMVNGGYVSIHVMVADMQMHKLIVRV